ncbi:MAG TPA: methyl-accepting chemotaxis protein [Symbiobacteriaceae bacterium]|nr:methyl-accepting chemotaxis protein [Symbiobacteriaceae bacterium]
MRRRFPIMLRISLAVILTLAVPILALVGLSRYLQASIRLDMEQRVETTLDMAINMEESLLREGLSEMRQAAAIAAADPALSASLAGTGAVPDLIRFQKAFVHADMIVLVDPQGTVRARATSEQTGDQVLLGGLVAYAIASGEPQAYPSLIGPEELQGEGQEIHQMVDMAILPTGGSTDPRVGGRVDTALALVGVAPVRSTGGDVVGAVIAADVLNRDFRIVDEVAQWAPVTTPMNSTIAMGGVRVTTNVRLRDPEGNPSEHRALGTLYSDAVMQSLAAAGVHRGRAIVVDQWQRAIYRAMTDFQGRMIAAPYVGIPEAVFADVGNKLNHFLRLAVIGGGVALLASLCGALWLTYRGTVLPLRRLAAQVRNGADAVTVAAGPDDEISDLTLAIQALLDRWHGAFRSVRVAADQLGASVDHLSERAPVAPDRWPAVTAAAGLRSDATAALEHLQRLTQSVREISDGVRSEERSIHYVERVAHEIGSGLEESRGTVEAAIADANRLTASARAALKQVGEYAAGLAVLRQSIARVDGDHGLNLLHDPSELLASLAALSERVADEVRTLVLVIQENQARLTFIREEMNRVTGVVQSTAASTHAAAQSAGQAIGWMEGMAAATVAVADEVLAARAEYEAAAGANRELQEWCGRIEEQVRQFCRTVAELKS